MDYLDFEIRIRAAGNERYRVEVASPAGEAKSDECELQSAELNIPLTRLVNSRALGVELDSGATTEPEPPPKVAEALGRQLFTALLPTEQLRMRYRLSLQQAQMEKKGLRFRLRIDAPELAGLPWEYVFDDELDRHVALAVDTPLTRYPEVARPLQPLDVEPPLRILGMVATPTDLPPLNVERERQQMEDAIDHLTADKKVELHWLEGDTSHDLQKALRNGPWHVLHFIGHGGFDAKSETGYLALCNDEGKCDRFTAGQLATLLDGHNLNLVLLNSCEGAKAGDSELFSSTGSALIQHGLPAVISMQYVITDHAAIQFSRMFYDAVAEGLPVDRAVQEARTRIQMAKADTVEWATPVLFLRAADGRLFHIDHHAAVRRGMIADSTSVQSVRDETAKTRSAAATREAGLNMILRSLEHDYRHVFAELKEDLSIEPRLSVIHGLKAGADGTTSTEGVVTGLAEQGGTVLILGGPGSGKTTIVRKILQRQLAAAANDESRPVWILLNLSSWNGEPMLEWAVDQIRIKTSKPPDAIRRWITDNSIALILDGFDEVRPEQRAACAAELDTFGPLLGISGLIVTCRNLEYRELPAPGIHTTAAVEVMPLSHECCDAYLEKLGAEYSGLQQILRSDSSMQILARSPLMLSLMVEVYRNTDAADLQSDAHETSQQRRNELMSAYVDQMFRKQKGTPDVDG